MIDMKVEKVDEGSELNISGFWNLYMLQNTGEGILRFM